MWSIYPSSPVLEYTACNFYDLISISKMFILVLVLENAIGELYYSLMGGGQAVPAGLFCPPPHCLVIFLSLVVEYAIGELLRLG